MNFTVEITGDKSITDFLNKFPKVLDMSVRSTAMFAKQEIVKATPRKTGTARRSWITNYRPFQAIITNAARNNSAPYATFLEYGTGVYGPYARPITAKDGKFLSFPMIKGNSVKGWVKTKSVKGIKPVKMIGKNLLKIAVFFQNNIQTKISDLWHKAGK